MSEEYHIRFILFVKLDHAERWRTVADVSACTGIGLFGQQMKLGRLFGAANIAHPYDKRGGAASRGRLWMLRRSWG